MNRRHPFIDMRDRVRQIAFCRQEVMRLHADTIHSSETRDTIIFAHRIDHSLAAVMPQIRTMPWVYNDIDNARSAAFRSEPELCRAYIAQACRHLEQYMADLFPEALEYMESYITERLERDKRS